jgi:hypothetical protein
VRLGTVDAVHHKIDVKMYTSNDVDDNDEYFNSPHVRTPKRRSDRLFKKETSLENIIPFTESLSRQTSLSNSIENIIIESNDGNGRQIESDSSVDSNNLDCFNNEFQNNLVLTSEKEEKYRLLLWNDVKVPRRNNGAM